MDTKISWRLADEFWTCVLCFYICEYIWCFQTCGITFPGKLCVIKIVFGNCFCVKQIFPDLRVLYIQEYLLYFNKIYNDSEACKARNGQVQNEIHYTQKSSGIDGLVEECGVLLWLHYWPFVWGINHWWIPLTNGQFCSISASISCWGTSWVASDLRYHDTSIRGSVH